MSAKTASENSFARNKHSAPSNRHYGAPPIDVTKEEFSRISEALKKEEFRKLFFEYCNEIQDPENRKRYEEEIKQLEAERGVEVKFINPEPGFVIKTSVDGALKCFVNVAKSSEVGQPSSEASLNPETGARGLNWSLPMAQSPPRDDVDAHGKRCVVYDVVFHPDAIYMAQRNSMFRKFVIDTALDAVEREFKVQLDRTNLKFPKLDFKGVSRPTVIRTLAKNAPTETAEPHPLESIYPAKPTSESSQTKILPMKTQTTPKPEYSTPKYTIKHRRDVDLAEFTNELDAKLNVTVPRALIVEIELPLLKSTAECQLDVTSKSIFLLSERVGAKYRLKLDLPYAVNDKEGSAHYDVDTRRLCLTLPVVQQNVQQQREMHQTLLHLNREDSGVESDIRDDANSNGDSPVEELADTAEQATATIQEAEAPTANPAAETITSQTFLKKSQDYLFPTKFDCNVLDEQMSLVLHVRNVQQESVSVLQLTRSVHVQFTSIGHGYYSTHYAFYFQLPGDCELEIKSANAEAWENNVVLSINLNGPCESLHCYLAGLDIWDLKEYIVQEKFKLAQSPRMTKKTSENTSASLSSAWDISVDRSKDERSIEILIKSHEHPLTAANNTTEDEENQRPTVRQKQNKKQKKKNKKRRSLSESACDDIKAYHKQQQEKKLDKTIAAVHDDDSSSPERDQPQAKTTASVNMSGLAMSAQQRKQRSYSECHADSNNSSILPNSFKSILKRYSRYEPRPSISESNSSFDDHSMNSGSVDASVSSSLPFSLSFGGIPEENMDGLSESCKKTVRFSETISKQVFRYDSSILGQRKKNQKRRDRKQRALQRRLSEGDSADYEDNKVVPLEANEAQYLKSKSKKNHREIDDDREEQAASDSDCDQDDFNDDQLCQENKIDRKKKNQRPRFESESCSDADTHKNAMIFDMEM